MMLNLGSGNKPEAGWCNVDLCEGADIQQDFRTLGFEPESVDRIQIIHAIEHIPRADALECFRNWYSWLKPGGCVVIETPCRLKCLAMVRGDRKFEGAKGIFGGRSKDKTGWHDWLKNEGWKRIAGDLLSVDDAWLWHVPDRFNIPGENHLYVWSGTELQSELNKIGFRTSITNPQHHGKRAHRDCRVVAVKHVESVE